MTEKTPHPLQDLIDEVRRGLRTAIDASDEAQRIAIKAANDASDPSDGDNEEIRELVRLHQQLVGAWIEYSALHNKFSRDEESRQRISQELNELSLKTYRVWQQDLSDSTGIPAEK